jgi:zinc protease
MKIFRIVIVTFAVALLTLNGYGQKTSYFNPDQIDIPYTKYVLDNGLTLIIHEDHKAPIVAVNIWYHVGSKRKTGTNRICAPF